MGIKTINGEPREASSGNLRDEFAKSIIQGMYASLIDTATWPDDRYLESMAQHAWKMADSMLATRTP